MNEVVYRVFLIKCSARVCKNWNVLQFAQKTFLGASIIVMHVDLLKYTFLIHFFSLE